MGWTPSLVLRDLETLRMYNQIMKMEPSRLTRRVFEYDLKCKGRWSSNLKSLLESLGCVNNLWLWNETVHIGNAKAKLLKMFEEAWLHQAREKPKLRTYVQFKTEFRAEDHLKVNLTKGRRSLLCRLRCGVLNL